MPTKNLSKAKDSLKPEDIAISVKNVSKSFKLPHEKQNSVKGAFINMFRGKKTYEKQQALKDISFDIKKGEFFGIVGRNGSGKSTLLKLISGIYAPDKGSITVNGKLVPFIELGVGFNPELSGRENVFLNGALLGFSRDEMDKMYDEIVEFAELERFMDQKLKNYSSGMQVRLAFSIAIRAKADILVLDEVLAVGDEAFQKKCDDYFKLLKNDNTKTVILVTHSMDSVVKYCDRAMLISDGELIINGKTNDVTSEYTRENINAVEANENKKSGKNKASKRIPYLKVTSNSKKVISSQDTLEFNIEYKIIDNKPVRIFFSVLDEKRGGSILANGTEPIKGEGAHSIKYLFPLKYYNDTDLLVVAAIDDARTKKRIAHTSKDESLRVAIRNDESDNGLLRRDNSIHGHWVGGYKEYMYNLKDI